MFFVTFNLIDSNLNLIYYEKSYSVLFITIGISLNAYVIICPYDGGSGDRSGCLKITKVNVDGEWVEANCDNVTVPDGWFIYNEDDC